MAVFDNINLSSSSGVKPSLIEYYERTILDNAKPELLHVKDAQKRFVPKNNGRTVHYRRMSPFAAITTPLQEGVTPNGQTITQTEITATIRPYGAYVPWSDELDWTTIGNLHRETATRLADQAALSLDTIARDRINAGLNVQYVDGTNNTTRGTLEAADKLTSAEVKKAVRTLRGKNAKTFPDGYFHAIVHPDVEFDLTSDAMWVDVAKYQDKSKIEKYEIGCMMGVKFFRSTNAKVFKTQSYLYGSKADLTMTVLDAANKCMTVSDTLTENDARNLNGMLVNVQYTSSGTSYVTPMCIDHVDYAAKKVYFRWIPASTTNWTTTNTTKIVPTGAGASSVDVYSTLIYGQDAYGAVSLEGGGQQARVIVNPPGSAGADDPLEQRGTIAWKIKGFDTTILQDDYIVRIESGATAA